jgi:hypothetical protein
MDIAPVEEVAGPEQNKQEENAVKIALESQPLTLEYRRRQLPRTWCRCKMRMSGINIPSSSPDSGNGLLPEGVVDKIFECEIRVVRGLPLRL